MEPETGKKVFRRIAPFMTSTAGVAVALDGHLNAEADY